MSQYTELLVGNFYFSWKNQVPPYLGLIFEESNYYSVWDHDENWYSGIGYRTTREIATRKLEAFGFTIDFLAEIYEYFYEDLFEECTNLTKETIKRNLSFDSEKISEEFIEKEYSAYANNWPMLSRHEELQNFVTRLEDILKPQFINPSDDRPFLIRYHGEIKEYPPRTYIIKPETEPFKIDLEEWESYLYSNPTSSPPWISMLVNLFQNYIYEYPEIVVLMFLRLIMEVSNNASDIVQLELSDIVENEEEVKEVLNGSNLYLLNKINLYNKFFHHLFLSEKDIRSNYIKAQCKEYLAKSLASSNPYEKGKLLEDLIEILFTAENTLELIDKRVSTGDEEIDLLIKNNIDRPFWLAFRSPLFFVECKNWSKPVGVAEVRNFEVKLINHASLVKVGFFVSINGFSKDAKTELKRLGRDEYHLVFIDKNDIEEYINSSKDFFEWLEKKASQIY